jgi:PAS domain S-box-containing protein
LQPGAGRAAPQVLTTVVDVTEHKQAEAARRELNETLEARVGARTQALHHSEARYRLLFDSIDEGFCIIKMLFDKSGRPVDYRFLEANPAFAKQTGLANAVGQRMRELAPQHEEHWFQTYGRIALTGEPERFVNHAQHLDNRWYDVYAFRIGQPEERKVAILFNDITDRKRAEESLQSLNERLEARVAERTAVLEIQGEQLRALNTRLAEVQEEERRRLARELHDRVGQNLSDPLLNLLIPR